MTADSWTDHIEGFLGAAVVWFVYTPYVHVLLEARRVSGTALVGVQAVVGFLLMAWHAADLLGPTVVESRTHEPLCGSTTSDSSDPLCLVHAQGVHLQFAISLYLATYLELLVLRDYVTSHWAVRGARYWARLRLILETLIRLVAGLVYLFSDTTSRVSNDEQRRSSMASLVLLILGALLHTVVVTPLLRSSAVARHQTRLWFVSLAASAGVILGCLLRLSLYQQDDPSATDPNDQARLSRASSLLALLTSYAQSWMLVAITTRSPHMRSSVPGSADATSNKTTEDLVRHESDEELEHRYKNHRVPDTMDEEVQDTAAAASGAFSPHLPLQPVRFTSPPNSADPSKQQVETE